jgi:hypothetical protein
MMNLIWRRAAFYLTHDAAVIISFNSIARTPRPTD